MNDELKLNKIKEVHKEIIPAGSVQIRRMEREEYPLLEEFLYRAIFQQSGRVFWQEE